MLSSLRDGGGRGKCFNLMGFPTLVPGQASEGDAAMSEKNLWVQLVGLEWIRGFAFDYSKNLLWLWGLVIGFQLLAARCW